MAFFYHRLHFFTKKTIAISSTGGVGVGNVLDYMEDNFKSMGFNRIYKVGVAMACRDDEKIV